MYEVPVMTGVCGTLCACAAGTSGTSETSGTKYNG